MRVAATAAALAALACLAPACTAFGGPTEEAGLGPIVVRESAPRYGNVGLGSRTRDVVRLLGEGKTTGGFAPAGRTPAGAAVPLSIPNPAGAGRERPALRRYGDSAFLFSGDRAYAMMLTGSHIRTSRGVGIGDPIAEVLRRYGHVRCSDVAGGESPFGRVETYASCRVRIGSRRFLVFGGDPIRSVTFFSSEPVR